MLPEFAAIPIAAALGYTLGALALKRASMEGVGPWRTTFYSNLTMGLGFAPLALGATAVPTSLLWQPLLAGFSFFIGQLFTFLSIHRGDVTVATPVMGAKVLFVALFAALLFGVGISAIIWLAAILTVVAVWLLRGDSAVERRRLLPAIGFGLLSAASFGMTDVLVQSWAGDFGFRAFVPLMFGSVAIISFGLWPLFSGGTALVGRAAVPWLALGCVLMAAQAFSMAFALSTYREATSINILYSTRGIWSIVLVAAVGAWFGIAERHMGRRTMLLRSAGATLLFVAVVLVILEG